METIYTPYTDKTLMPFGKFKGDKLENVPAAYLLWINDAGSYDKKLVAYIKDNLNVIQNEVKKKG